MMFEQDEFNKFIIDHSIIGFFAEPVQLASGRTSHWYVNWRKAANDVWLMDRLTDYIISFAESKQLDADCFYGVPEGATKTGVIATFKLAKRSEGYGLNSHALPMGRARPKDHGSYEDRYFIGRPKGKTVVLEDVTTTGASLLNTIETLLANKVNIVAAVSLTNRMELRDDGISVQQAVNQKNLPYHHMSNALELLPMAYQRLKPSDEIAEFIEEEFARYGLKRLRLRK